jgi:hypothetical protein
MHILPKPLTNDDFDRPNPIAVVARALPRAPSWLGPSLFGILYRIPRFYRDRNHNSSHSSHTKEGGTIVPNRRVVLEISKMAMQSLHSSAGTLSGGMLTGEFWLDQWIYIYI